MIIRSNSIINLLVEYICVYGITIYSSKNSHGEYINECNHLYKPYTIIHNVIKKIEIKSVFRILMTSINV